MSSTIELSASPARTAAPLTGVERILSAVVFGAQHFMSTQDWSGFLEAWLERLGAATSSHQVRIFVNDEAPPGEVRSSLRMQWLAPGAPGDPMAALQHVSLRAAGCGRWVEMLARGESVVGNVAELPACEQTILRSQGCVSVAIVPVFAEGRWWGFIGFADCTAPRTWTAAELSALFAAAGIYGAALTRQRMELRLEAAMVQERLAADIGEVVTAGSASLDDTLQLCSAHIAHRLGADLVRIWSADRHGGMLRSLSGAGPIGESLVPSELRIGESSVGRIAARCEAELWADGLPELWPGSTRLTRAAGLLAGAGHPLLCDGKVAGVVVLLNRHTPSRAVLDGLASITDELALAIEHSRAIAALHATEERYRRLVEAAVEGICIHDGSRVHDVNPSLAAQLGHAVSEIVGQSPLAFIHPDSHDEVKRRLATNYTGAYEATMLCRDGSTFPAELKGRNFVQDGVKLRVATIRDLTERKEAERTARKLIEERTARELSERSRRHAEFLADASRILASSFDTTTTLNQLARLCVPLLGECCVVSLLNGDTAEDVALVHADEETTPEGCTIASWTRQLQTGNTLHALHALHALQLRGEAFIVSRGMAVDNGATTAASACADVLDELGTPSLMSVPIRSGGELVGSILLLAGAGRAAYVAEQLAVAEELGRRAAVALQSARSYHDARAATQARDDLLAVVAHDLRNPLNTIQMGSTHALEMTAEEPSAPARRQLEIILRSAEHMNRLIQDLLDATRLQAGQLALEIVPTRPATILREAAEILLPLAANAGITLETTLPDSVQPVPLDRMRVQQVLSNLVGNALKFTPRGGQVRISAEQCSDGVCFRVSDTGQGIAEDQLAHIFGRFWQARSTDRRGLGLGLAIAKGIVEAHGGRIWVESRPGAGSSFSFSIPNEPAVRAPL